MYAEIITSHSVNNRNRNKVPVSRIPTTVSITLQHPSIENPTKRLSLSLFLLLLILIMTGIQFLYTSDSFVR